MFSGTVEGQAFLFILAGLVAGLLLIGWRTQLMTVLSWALMVSLHARNPAVLQGGDTVFRLLLFWGIFLPLGARWSIDSSLSDTSDYRVAKCYTSISSFAYILQVCFVYLFSAVLKTGDAWLKDFDAVYYALAIDQFTSTFGDWLFKQNILHEPLTIATLGLEAFGWILLLIPVFKTYFRLIAIGAFIGMHLGFAATMQLGLFSYIMCVAWLALLPGAVWNFLRRQLMSFSKEWNIHISGDPSGKVARLIRTLLVTTRLKLKTKPNSKEYSIREGDYAPHRGRSTHKSLIDRSIIFSFLELPFIRRAVKILTQNGRQVIGNNSSKKLLYYSPHQYIIKTIPFFVGLFLLSVLSWNLYTVGNGWSMPEPWREGVKSLRLDQKWNMFAPYPLKADGWYVLSGALEDGGTVGLFFENNFTRNLTRKPKDVSQMYPNQRWRKYLMNLRRPGYSEQRGHFSSWLCYMWNVKHENKKRLSTLNIIFIEERTLPPQHDREVDVQKVDLGSYRCSIKASEHSVAGETVDQTEKHSTKTK
ncbi:HTTM domain-containing protein [Salinibacter ruber]|uniref:HTTM domain-containing protein n=1 Tax=Salinibacter ruber TaxID=146919 RepID=UPI0020737414|nr:HTTM domain-containing protein [Salinibacter ruber]